jgi:SMODS domain-containing protein
MNDHFLKLKQNLELNPSFDQIVQARHSAVRTALENRSEITKNTQLIGSLQRKTRLQPRENDIFDIDILVVLGEFYSWLPIGDPNGVLPEQALNHVYRSINKSERYSLKNPEKDSPTVSLQFADKVKVELVPAYLDMIGHSPDGKTHTPVGRSYWVPDNGRWVLADYDFEADYITKMNTASGGYLVPTIKMLKAIKRLHFPYLKSFPLEILAVETIPAIVSFKRTNYQTISYPELVNLFFILAKDSIMKPIQMPGSNSPAIRLDRAMIGALGKIFDDIVFHIDQIDWESKQDTKTERWRVLFGESFPTKALSYS